MSTDLQQRSPSFRAFYQEEQRKFDAKAAALLAPAQQALIAANREKADIWRKTPVEKWTTVKDMEFLSSVAPDIGELRPHQQDTSTTQRSRQRRDVRRKLSSTIF